MSYTFVSQEMWVTFGRSRTLLAGRSPESYGQRTSRASWNFSGSDFELNTTVGKWGLWGGTIDIPQVWKWKWKWKSLSCVWLFATPWNSLGQNTGVGNLSLFHRIFPTQGLYLSVPGQPAGTGLQTSQSEWVPKLLESQKRGEKDRKPEWWSCFHDSIGLPRKRFFVLTSK